MPASKGSNNKSYVINIDASHLTLYKTSVNINHILPSPAQDVVVNLDQNSKFGKSCGCFALNVNKKFQKFVSLQKQEKKSYDEINQNIINKKKKQQQQISKNESIKGKCSTGLKIFNVKLKVCVCGKTHPHLLTLNGIQQCWRCPQNQIWDNNNDACAVRNQQPPKLIPENTLPAGNIPIKNKSIKGIHLQKFFSEAPPNVELSGAVTYKCSVSFSIPEWAVKVFCYEPTATTRILEGDRLRSLQGISYDLYYLGSISNDIATVIYDSNSNTSTIQYDLTTMVNGQLQTSAVTIQTPGEVNDINYIHQSEDSKYQTTNNNERSSKNTIV